MRRVEVTPYNEKWPLMYMAEEAKLKHILGGNIVAIYHIGSTSVPSVKAKPIIDIMPVVKDINLVDRFNEEMREFDYEPMGEFGMIGRRYFHKGKKTRTHHVHIFQDGSPDIERHLAFRDYLREHSDVSDRYGALKEKLAKQFPNDMDSYINGKDALVKEIEAQALEWFVEISNET